MCSPFRLRNTWFLLNFLIFINLHLYSVFQAPLSLWDFFQLRAALHEESRPFYCLRLSKSMLPIGWNFEISPRAFTRGGKANFWKNILMFNKQGLTRPTLQKLGPPIMDSQFLASGLFLDFIILWSFLVNFFFLTNQHHRMALKFERLYLVSFIPLPCFFLSLFLLLKVTIEVT
jgi:hypothetical protein